MEQTIKRRNIYLDLFKYFLALLVISIHTIAWPFNELHRVAVIMFFMLAGFFTYTSDPSKQLPKAKKLILRSFIYMIIGFVIYILYDVYLYLNHELDWNYYFHFFTIKRTYIDLFAYALVPRYVHLWYMISVFVISIIHYVIVKLKITCIYKWLATIILVTVFVLCSSVYPRLPHYDVKYLRNPYLMGLPMFAIGYLLNQAKQKGTFNYNNIINLAIGGAFYMLQIVEMQLQTKEYYFASVVSSVFLILFFTNLECKHLKAERWYYNWIGVYSAYFIYVIHWMVMERLDKIYRIDIPFVKPFTVLVISFAIYEVLFLIFKFGKFCYTKIKDRNKDKDDETIIELPTTDCVEEQ